LEQFALNFAPTRRVFTVAELNSSIAELLGVEFDDVWISGEISGTKILQSGHCYFTLKEKDSQLRCALFKGTMRFLKFKPQDGVAVLARGRIEVFQPRGEYQLVVEMLEPQGHGALQFAFEQLKKRLSSEGLFDSSRKRRLPRYPSRIGLVTSPRGAVISDILHVLERRFPGLAIRLFPALVQGEGSVDDVVRGIEYFSRSGWAQVVILARGGGSLEDLWTFNEERVARAIVACSIPVISAIGHETDFTIADFVADQRAATPSAAAEIVVCSRQELLEGLSASAARLLQSVRYRLAILHRRIGQQGAERSEAMLHRSINRRLQMLDDKDTRIRDMLRRRIALISQIRSRAEERLRYFDPRPRLQRDRNRLVVAEQRGIRAIQLSLSARLRSFEKGVARLEQLSPLRVLERGYAIVKEKKNGGIVKDPATVEPGTALEIRVAAGVLEAEAK